MNQYSNFNVNIIKSKRKSYVLKINQHNEVELRVPFYFEDKDYKTILEKHNNWIIKHLKLKENSKNEFYDELVNYKILFLFGDVYNICLKNDIKNYKNYRIENKSNIKNVYISSLKNTEMAIQYLIQSEFIKFINTNLLNDKKYDNFIFEKIKLSSAKKRWGSCSTKGTINLSWRLAMAPISVIESVFIHELVHTLEFNHSKKFYNLIDKYDLNAKESNVWLKKNSFILKLYSGKV